MIETVDSQFKEIVSSMPGGVNLNLCYACGACTAVCPVSRITDEFNPRKIIRMVLLGLKDEVLSGHEIWLCYQCHACMTRCPQDVRFTEIIKALRRLAVAEGYATQDFADKVEDIDAFSKILRKELVKGLYDGNPDEAKAAMIERIKDV